MNKKISFPISLVIIIVLAVLVVGGIFAYQYFYIQNQPKTSNPVAQAKNCVKSGALPIDEFLPSYSVKQGDTLLSISKDILKDVSRVEEIVRLNNDIYPQLSLENPFLEVGWKLRLPPANVSKTIGVIHVHGGSLSISDSSWGVFFRTGSVGPFELSQLPPSFTNGECIILMWEGPYIKNGVMDYSIPLKVISLTKAE